MRAHDMGRDEIAAFLVALDSRWDEAIRPARLYGFIASAAGGTAVMMTYANMVEAQGLEGAARMLQMNGVEVPIEEDKQ